MKFEDLNLTKPLLRALEDMGMEQPTTIQAKVFSTIMSGKDVIGIAQTGTGKTFAYLLPCLRQWTFSKERFAQILILVPTRELVSQVVDEVNKLTPYMNVVTVGVYGGVNMKTQILEIDKGLDVIVATPGRLLDLVMSGYLKLKNIRKLVIDEVDEMLNLGFRTQLVNILNILPAKRQNMLFSATITEDIEDLSDEYFNFPKKIEAAPTGTPLENISQFAYPVPNFNTKLGLLKHLLATDESMAKVLVFTSTKYLADLLFERMEQADIPDIGVFHSNKSQNYRFNAIKQFEEGTLRVLVATDIAARGLDITEVTHVINFDMPDHPENYIHRIGRTGRASNKGVAIAFVSVKDKDEQDAIEQLMNYQIPMLPFPDEVEISEQLLVLEEPTVVMKTIKVKMAHDPLKGAAFHEKSEKRKKVNVRKVYEKEPKKKYKTKKR